MKYQVQKTTATNISDETMWTINLVGKPVLDLKLAKSKLALEMMRDERLGVAAKYCIIKINEAGDMAGLVKLKQSQFVGSAK